MSTTIPIGPFHPFLEEPEYITLEVEGERVLDADIDLGRIHRGMELLAEEKTFDQDCFLVERICGICSASHSWTTALAIEDAAGIGPTPRARYLRTIVHELERLHSHMLWVGLAGHIIGYWTVYMWGWKYREPVLDALEAITGNRNNYAWYCPGGVRRDVPDEIWPPVLKAMDEFTDNTNILIGAVLDDPVILGRLKGV
ncbi:nickel-dependent hydrogenase large subunit, partial [bacterium]|nr:nickel-dependent hydrogenase large subunit [bacterium]